MRFILLLCVFWGLAGCAYVPFGKSLKLHPQQYQIQEEELFHAALDEFSVTNKLDLMQQFLQQYPDSEIAVPAETIILYARELDTRKAQLTAEREENQRLAAELDSLKQENVHLNEKIEQLKILLIELEQRPK